MKNAVISLIHNAVLDESNGMCGEFVRGYINFMCTVEGAETWGELIKKLELK